MMEDLVRHLREQEAILTTYLRDQRNYHEDAVLELEKKHEEIRKQMIAMHDAEKEKLKREQAEYVSLLRRHHKSINATIEKSFQEKIKHLKSEYALLQAALRNYKQAVRSDIGKTWDGKVEQVKASSERIAAHQIRLAQQKMQRQFEIRKADMAHSFQHEVDERVKVEVEKELAKLLSKGTVEGTSSAVSTQVMSQNTVSEQSPDAGNGLLLPSALDCQTNQAVTDDAPSTGVTNFVENVQNSKLQEKNRPKQHDVEA